jgi:hypothetical protein
MKRKNKSRKTSPRERSNRRMFTTIDEFSSHFFPKGRPAKEFVRGKERGAKAAEHAFTEIAKVLQT